jgi:hypothetical protein
MVLGVCIDNGRSGTEAVKRIIKYMSCSGRGVALAMPEVEGRRDEALKYLVQR